MAKYLIWFDLIWAKEKKYERTQINLMQFKLTKTVQYVTRSIKVTYASNPFNAMPDRQHLNSEMKFRRVYRCQWFRLGFGELFKLQRFTRVGGIKCLMWLFLSCRFPLGMHTVVSTQSIIRTIAALPFITYNKCKAHFDIPSHSYFVTFSTDPSDKPDLCHFS